MAINRLLFKSLMDYAPSSQWLVDPFDSNKNNSNWHKEMGKLCRNFKTFLIDMKKSKEKIEFSQLFPIDAKKSDFFINFKPFFQLT